MNELPDHPVKTPPPAHRMIRALAWLVLLLAVAMFMFRGPYAASQREGDFSVIYAAARTWMFGGNPYDYDQLNQTLDKSGAPSEHRPAADSLQSVYPPPTFPAFFDISLLPWTWAKPTFIIVNCIFLLAIVFLLMNLSKLTWPNHLAVFFTAFVMAFGPMHTTIWLGQLTIVALACLVLAICFYKQGRLITAGIFLGLTSAVKIHFGLPFIVYYLFRKRWSAAASALVTLAILAIVAIVRMKLAGVDWLDSWRDNIHTMISAGNNADPTAANPLRYQLINLQYLLHTVINDRLLVTAMTYGFVGAVAVLTIILISGNDKPGRELLGLAMVGTLDLLITYHRYYDAAMLVLPLAWAFAMYAAGQRIRGAIVMVLVAIFLLPGAVLLMTLANKGLIPDVLVTSALWEIIILPHQVWTLLALTAVLLWNLAAGRMQPTATN